MKKASGGYVVASTPTSKQEVVVGYIMGVKPVYDVDWFDKKIGGHAFRVEINHDKHD